MMAFFQLGIVLLLAMGGNADAAAVLTARCEPAEVVRGQQVHCTASIEPPQAVVLVERRAEALGHQHVERVTEGHAAGQPISWDGRAIVPTRVRFIVQASSMRLEATTAFTIRPRSFPRALLAPDQFNCEIDRKAAILPDPPLLEGGATKEEPLPANGSLSRAILTIAPPPFELENQGPDASWYLVTGPIENGPTLKIWLARALERGDAFYRDQYSDRSLPSKSAGLFPHCRKADLDSLRRLLGEAEGCRGESEGSRRSRVRRILEKEVDLNASLEDLVVPLTKMDAPENPFVKLLDARLHELGKLALGQDAAQPRALPLACRLRYRQ